MGNSNYLLGPWEKLQNFSRRYELLVLPTCQMKNFDARIKISVGKIWELYYPECFWW